MSSGPLSADGASILADALRRFAESNPTSVENSDRAAGTSSQTCSRDTEEEKAEMRNIVESFAFQKSETRSTGAVTGTDVIPCFYRRYVRPQASDAWIGLLNASKMIELNIRFVDIEHLDIVADSDVLRILNANGTRDSLSVDEYMDAMARANDVIRSQTGGGREGESATHRELNTLLNSITSVSRIAPSATEATDYATLPYLSSVPPPFLTLRLFLSCSRNGKEKVDVSQIFLRFGKHVSLYKTEAELMLCDTDNDGRLTEDELEAYVRNLVPTIVALHSLPQDILPFYFCAVSRRVLWTLDPGNRGSVSIDDLLHSAVMDEWLDLQLMTEDNPRNWFGASITTQLYDKFLLLDTRNEGMLNATNMKRYKKGTPTVLNDGLPLDVSPLSSLFIDRFFEVTATMAESELDFRKFVDFVIAVEFLPQCSRPVFMWNIMNITKENVITPLTFMAFFKETYAKLISAGVEAPPIDLIVLEAFDIIPTAEPLRITREEFINSPQAGLFAAITIDCLSFWTYENREPR